MSASAADFDDEVLGHGLPDAAATCIRDAGRQRAADPARALERLLEARRLAPAHPATLIALYRFHFYGHRLAAARELALDALQLGGGSLGLPARWQDVAPQAMGGARFDPATRFYLFALKGYAYLSLRLGELETAAQALELLHRLDPEDRVGGKVLSTVLARAGRDEDETEDEPVSAEAAA
jgi:tetratricopeptide (TPR) repeat protein